MEQQNKRQNILSIDIGHGDIKVSWKEGSEKVKSFKFPSVAAKAPSEAIDMPLFEGIRYFLEEEAMVQESKDIIDAVSYEDLNKIGPVFIWKVLEKLNITDNDVDYFITGLSLTQTTHGEAFVKRLSKFKINDTVYSFKDKIDLLPQGLGAKYAIEHYFKEEVPSTYLIIDIGFNTIDVVDVINRKVRPENIEGHPNEGVIKIARKVQELILDKFDSNISLKEAKHILENNEYFIDAKLHSLTDEIDIIKKEYTHYIVSFLKNTYTREFRKYRKIYVVGGGSYYIDVHEEPIIEKIENSEYLNSLGNIFFKELMLNKNL
jgi:hypothetical protein